MASGEAAAVPDPPQSKTVVLKVFIHCPGCKKKVQRIVKRINGVSTCDVDAPQNKVTVTGNVDADSLIKKLLKSGKQADLWPEPKNHQKPPQKKETSEKSQKNPSETPKEIDTKAAKEPHKPKKSAKEDDPKPDESKTQSSSEAPPAKIPASGEEAGSSTGANKKEKKAQNSTKPADNTREADSAAPPDVRMHQTYLPPPPPAIVSYNTAQPSTSHAYYAAAPMPHMMSQGYAAAPVPHMMPQGYAAAPVPHMMPQGYAAAPVPHMMPQGYTYAPYYPALPPPQQLPLEDLYYGPPGSRLSSPPRDQYEYAVFNDENANSCNVM